MNTKKSRHETTPRATSSVERLDDESLRAVSGGSKRGSRSAGGKKTEYLAFTMQQVFVT